MNVLTFGLLIGNLKVDQFTVSSKIISQANTMFPDTNIVLLDMAGKDIIDVYKKLPYETQTRIVDLEVMEGLEERNFYKELELLQALTLQSKEYNNSSIVNMFIATMVVLLITFTAAALVYHYNTKLNNDGIPANMVTAIMRMIKYVVSNFI